jgi:hypothetical protein
VSRDAGGAQKGVEKRLVFVPVERTVQVIVGAVE